MKKLFTLTVLGFVLTINFLLFQNFSVNSGTPPAATTPLSALAFVERSLIELNQLTNDPSMNALMVMTSFSVTNLVAAYTGNYNALNFSIEATKYAIEKYDRYEVSGFTNMNAGDANYVQAVRNAIRPFLNSTFIPNIPYVMPLTADISVEATSGVLNFVTYDNAGNRVFTKTYDYTNFYRLGQEIKAQIDKRRTSKTVYEPFPRYLSALDDDERDLYDRTINTTKVLLQEMGITGDGKVSINDLVNGDVILNPSEMSVPDLVPVGFDLAGAPIYSKINYSSKSSFDPDKFSFETQGKIVASSDPYDTAITTPDPLGTGGGSNGGIGSGGSGTGSSGTSGSSDAWYDSYDDSTTDNTTPGTDSTTTGGSGGSSGSGGSTPTTPPSDGHTYGGEGE